MNLETQEITVNNLIRYPVKSAKREELQTAEILKTGIENDRNWMLVNAEGKALTQRTLPLMANIVINSTKEALFISIPGYDDCKIDKSSKKNSCKVEIWSDLCDAFEVEGLVNDYLTQYLNTECKLVTLNHNKQRQITDPAAEGVVTFADAFPFLIVGTASLNNLNKKLETKISMKNFRPNIVVNTSIAHEEDLWDEIQIGEVIFKNVKLCSRCILTTIDPDTAIFSNDKEPLQTLLTYRLIDGKIMFGSNLIAMNEGEIKKGDELKVLSYKK